MPSTTAPAKNTLPMLACASGGGAGWGEGGTGCGPGGTG